LGQPKFLTPEISYNLFIFIHKTRLIQCLSSGADTGISGGDDMDEEKIGRAPRAAVGSRGRAGGGCIPYGVSAPVCLDEKWLAARWRNVAFTLNSFSYKK
jgi:hypothetical protein